MSDKDYTLAVGRYIADLRMKKNLSQTDCGKLANISRSTMSDIEKGFRLPSGKDVVSLCGVLGVTPNDIFSHGDDGSVFNQAKTVQDKTAEDFALLAQSFYSFYKLSRSSKKSVHDVMYKMALSENGQEFAATHETIKNFVHDFVSNEATKELGLITLNQMREKSGKQPLEVFEIDSVFSQLGEMIVNGELSQIAELRKGEALE